MGTEKNDFMESVRLIHSNRLIGFQATQAETEPIVEVLNLLKEYNLTTDRMIAILEDCKIILPRITHI